MGIERLRLAVLIDGDFVEPHMLGRSLAWAAGYGATAIRRIYGNQTKMRRWAECIRLHGIEIRPNYAEGRNAADITIIIDAVDLLHSGDVDSFCIVASDNHFAGLARRLRRDGAHVAGLGSSRKPPCSLADECDIFAHVEELPVSDSPDPATQRLLSGWKGAVRDAVRRSAPDGQRVPLSQVGNSLREMGITLDPHTYCHGHLSSLVGSCPEFRVEDEHITVVPAGR